MGVDHPGDLNQALSELWRAVRRLAKATFQHAAIGHGGLRVYDGGGITIENGGLSVTGTATVIGLLTGNGDIIWTGPVTISGATDITGDLDVTGNTEITGPLSIDGATEINGATEITGNTDITGDVDLTGDMNVGSGGSITIAGTNAISLAASGGVARIGVGGSQIRGGDSGIVIEPGAGPSMVIGSSGVRIAVLPTITGVTPNLYMNALGYMYRVV